MWDVLEYLEKANKWCTARELMGGLKVNSAIYPQLVKLERINFIETKAGKPTGNGRSPRLYKFKKTSSK